MDTEVEKCSLGKIFLEIILFKSIVRLLDNEHFDAFCFNKFKTKHDVRDRFWMSFTSSVAKVSITAFLEV